MVRVNTLRAGLVALLLGCAVLPAHATDNTAGTLDSDLAVDAAAGLLKSNYAAMAAPPSLAAFEALYTSFEQVRKWQAFLDAARSAHLDTTAPAFAKVAGAVASLDAQHVDRVSLATAAIGKLAGIQNWHATDKAQSDLVVEQLSELLTEITEPQQRVLGQLVLARVELGSTTPQTARAPVKMALTGLAQITSAATQRDLATRLAEVIFTIKDPRAIEIASEIVSVIHDPTDRAALTDAFAARLAQQDADRLAAAAVIPPAGTMSPDPLGLAWAYHLGRLGGHAIDLSAALTAVGDDIDPLPTVVLLASGLKDEQMQQSCGGLVGHVLASGNTLRALNLRKMLPAEDCPPGAALLIAAQFADQHFDTLADTLAADYLKAVAGGYHPAADENATIEAVLQSTGATGLVEQQAAPLRQLLGEAEYAALDGRAAVTAALGDRQMRAKPLPAAITKAAAGYPASKAMLGLLASDAAGNETVPATAVFAAADLPLLGRIGAELARSPAAAPRVTAFLGGGFSATARFALADGITSAESFHPIAGDPLTTALKTLSDGSDPLLAASLGALDDAALAGASDEVLRRAARQAAWAGDAARANKIAAMSKTPGPITLDVASIGAVTGDFDAASAKISAEPDSAARDRAFRFIAEQRVAMLDIHNWPAADQPATTGGSAQLIKTSAEFEPSGTAGKSRELSVSPSGAATAQIAPPLPDLDVQSRDVTARVPYPTGGVGGLVVGGEGRYVRLARFESPNFDNNMNDGVRDYVYHQNKTITPQFIFLNTGVFTLADVLATIGRDETDSVVQLPNGVVRFNRPVAIGPDATLILSGDEAREIQFNSTLGAYLVNAGHLYVTDARVVGFDTVANAPARVVKGDPGNKFRPFILSWSASETNAANSEFVALGYSAGRSYGFSLTSGPADDFYARSQAAAPTGTIVNNSFDNLYYGFYAFEADAVKVVGNEYRNSIVYGIDPHDRSKHLNLSLNATYGAFKKHGIIISREVDDSFIVGNLSFENHGSGVMLDRASVGTVIVGNTLRNNDGDGMAVFESPCTFIGRNDISANHRSGVLVRNSWDVTVSANRIDDNKSAAVQGFISDLTRASGSNGRNFDVDPYQPFTNVSIRYNAIASNGSGIQMAGVSAADVFDNHFRYQSRRLFGGDLNGLAAVLLENGSHMPTTVATNCVPVLVARKYCILTEIGAVLPMTTGRYPEAPKGNYCLSNGATPQAQAFNAGAH